MRKYDFTTHTLEYDGHQLKQIRACRALEGSSVVPGQLGGWIAQESNLSHEGECWVYPQACVLEQARVSGDCRIADRAVVRGQAQLSDFILLYDDAEVTDQVVMEGVASVRGQAFIYGSAHIHCGEDGPQLLPGVSLNFDVAYQREYALLSSAADSGCSVAVSRRGQVCLAATYDYPRWSGSIKEFRALVRSSYAHDSELGWLLRCAELYLAS